VPIRSALLAAAEARYDLIIVGAGINGAGIARDAAYRGLKTLLLDKGDVGGGTTSWSTRLIHGGLRYLEHGEVGLVRESLRERERLLRLAPHLVRPLPLMIPIYRGDRRGPLLIRAGMIAYDALSFDKSLDRHQMLGREAALARAPGLAPQGLLGAAVYYDAQVEYAERLAVENALDAVGHEATLVTYAEVERLLVDGGTIAGVAVRDRLAGEDEPALVELRAPVVLNVAGPWVDRVLAGLDTGVPPRSFIGGTKGSHIVVGAFPGAPGVALYVEARRDRRPFFIVPWNSQYLIGTTDTRYRGDLDLVVVDDDEIEYLLAETNRVVPAAGLGWEDVRFGYAGIRPLPHQPAGLEGAITRRHQIIDHAADGRGGPAGLMSVVGGKLTTYRELAAQALEAVGKRLGRPLPPAATDRLPLPGGAVAGGEFQVFRARFLAECGLPPSSADHLLRVYGGRADAVLAEAGDDPSLREPFDPATGAIAAEIPFAFRREAAATLVDVLARRTMVGLGPEAGVGADEAAAAVAQRTLGWDDARAEREVAAYRRYVERLRPRSLAAARLPVSDTPGAPRRSRLGEPVAAARASS